MTTSFSSFPMSMFFNFLFIFSLLAAEKCNAHLKPPPPQPSVQQPSTAPSTMVQPPATASGDKLPVIGGTVVAGFSYRAYVQPPGCMELLFLAGTGVKNIVVEGKEVLHSSCGFYLSPKCLPFIGDKWKGKLIDQLVQTVEYFLDLAKGPFDKYCKVRVLVATKGEEFAKKITDGCQDILTKSQQLGEQEKAALVKFGEAFKGKTFEAGASVHITLSGSTLTVAFSKEGSLVASKEGAITIDCKAAGEAFIMTVINQHTSIRESITKKIADLCALAPHNFVPMDFIAQRITDLCGNFVHKP